MTKITSTANSSIGTLAAPASVVAARSAATGTASAAAPAAADTVSLTGDALRMQQLEKSISQSPDDHVDGKRVAAARAAIANGTYKVDSRATAGKLSRMESDLAGA